MSEIELGTVLKLFDDQIHGEGLERLRLILYSLLPWAELKSFTKPSDMYIKLASLENYSEHGRALQVFLFCLKAIGGSVRGKYCAKEARRSLNYHCTLDFSRESRKFRFFFCFLKIVRRLPTECKEDILQNFGRSLKKNYRHYEGSLSSLFIELYQGGKVCEDDTTELGDVLITCKKRFEEGTLEWAAAEKCISYLTKFNNDEMGEPFTSADEESTALSMQESNHKDKPSDSLIRKRPKRPRSTKKKTRGRYPSSSSIPYDYLASCIPVNPDGDNIDDPAPREMETSTDSVHYMEGAGGRELPASYSAPPVGTVATNGACDDPVNTSEGELIESLYFVPSRTTSLATSINAQPSLQDNLPVETAVFQTPSPATSRPRTNCWSRISNNKKKVAVIGVSTLLLSAIIVAICAIYVWVPLHNLTKSHDVQHREGNVPILSQLNSFVVEKFRVVQEIDSKDSLHIVSVYLPNYGCNGLPTNTTTHHYNEIFPPTADSTYMLEHSHISLQASATTEEPEYNPIFLYITKTVEKSINFDGDQKKGRYSIFVGVDGSLRRTNIPHPITESDYYSIRFSTVPPNVNLTYNLTLKIKKVDLGALNLAPVGTIYPNSSDQTLEKNIDFGTGEYCLLADIRNSAIVSTHNYTTLETHMEPRLDAGIGITVGSLLAFIILVLLSGALAVFYGKEFAYFCLNKLRGYTSVD